jgi:hypothetical protein
MPRFLPHIFIGFRSLRYVEGERLLSSPERAIFCRLSGSSVGCFKSSGGEAFHPEGYSSNRAKKRFWENGDSEQFREAKLLTDSMERVVER